jgi:heptosyltransferase-1
VSKGQAANGLQPARPWVALVHGTSRCRQTVAAGALDRAGPAAESQRFFRGVAHGNPARKPGQRGPSPPQLDDAWVWPSMGLDALTDTMAHCAGVIGVDSGVSHIAVALGLPHVQIYNFETAWRTGPRSEGPKARAGECV